MSGNKKVMEVGIEQTKRKRDEWRELVSGCTGASAKSRRQLPSVSSLACCCSPRLEFARRAHPLSRQQPEKERMDGETMVAEELEEFMATVGSHAGEDAISLEVHCSSHPHASSSRV